MRGCLRACYDSVGVLPNGSGTSSIGGTLSDQVAYDLAPLYLERVSADWLPRLPVPVIRVALIAFLAMQIGVYPRTCGAFILLRKFMCELPIAPGIPPQGGKSRCEFHGRLRGGQ
jgi:hypothetical protein